MLQGPYTIHSLPMNPGEPYGGGVVCIKWNGTCTDYAQYTRTNLETPDPNLYMDSRAMGEVMGYWQFVASRAYGEEGMQTARIGPLKTSPKEEPVTHSLKTPTATRVTTPITSNIAVVACPLLRRSWSHCMKS